MSLAERNCENTVFYMDVAKLVFFRSSAPIIDSMLSVMLLPNVHWPIEMSKTNGCCSVSGWTCQLVGYLYFMPAPVQEKT
jgi:hypothetical protein